MALYGGRGANSGYGSQGINTSGNNRPQRFYDKSDRYRGMTYLEFENRIRGRKNEWIGLYDENGKIVIAGTSYSNGSVAIPTTHPDFNKISNLTHNHPSDGKTRHFGGPLSEADVLNGLALGLNNSRAVAREKTYVLNKGKTTTSAGTRKLYKRADKISRQDVWNKQANKTILNVQKRLKAQGKSLSGRSQDQIYLGAGTRIWKNAVQGTGYNYIEIKNK